MNNILRIHSSLAHTPPPHNPSAANVFEIDSENEGKVTNNHSSIIYNFRFDQFQCRSFTRSVGGAGFGILMMAILLLQIRLPALFTSFGGSVRYRATRFRSHIYRTKGSDGGESNSYRPLPLFFCRFSATCAA